MNATSFLLLCSAAITHAAPVYQLHEWGTFTTVSGSDGVLLSGLEREEEQLPGFVESHDGFENSTHPNMNNFARIAKLHGTSGYAEPGQKGLANRPLAGVTVKMETPVLYFHSPEAFRAKVNIGFEGGTISQWYPERTKGDTPPEPAPPADPEKNPTPFKAWLLDFNQPYHGSIEWNVDVLSPTDSTRQLLFKPGDTLGWVRARVPEANVVRTASGQTEGYLFYRGLGHFDPGLKTTVDADEVLHLRNQTGGAIPYLIAFERLEDGSLRWSERRDALAAEGSIDLPESSFKTEPKGFPETVYKAVHSGLAGCGLTDAEAHAMVQTWWHSCFESRGLRVFWVLPRDKTDQLLPLEVSPAPNQLVRVLVGRSEVLRPRDEKEWLRLARLTGNEAYVWSSVVHGNRFGLAIKERIQSLDHQAAK